MRSWRRMRPHALDYQSPLSTRAGFARFRLSQRFVAVHGINLCVGLFCLAYIPGVGGWTRLLAAIAAAVCCLLQFIVVTFPAWWIVAGRSHLTVPQKLLVLAATSAGTFLSGLGSYLGWTTDWCC